MEGDNVVIDIPMCSNVLTDMTADTDNSSEISRKCPLCQSDVRLFFINFNEKFLMCENTECEFPFGYEDLQFVTIDNEVAMAEVCSTRAGGSIRSSFNTVSTISNSGLSEMERINQMYETVQGEADTTGNDGNETDKKQAKVNKEKTLRRKLKKDNEDKIRKHLVDIDNLHKELLSNISSQRNSEEKQIRNEKWIRKLKNLQETTGVQLLKPEEMKLLKKEEPAIGLGELKIDIDPGSSTNMSTIKIAIHNCDAPDIPEKE